MLKASSDFGIDRRGSRLEALQILRAIAAGMVVFVHALSTYVDKVGSTEESITHFGFGELGVKLFFCISGYIIFASTQRLNPGWLSVSFFLRRRLIRLAPIYWAATLIYALKLSLQGMPPSVVDTLYSIFFIPYLDSHGLMRPVLGAGWTLNYEMFFYLILAGTLLLSVGQRLPVIVISMVSIAALKHFGYTQRGHGFVLDAFYLLSDSYLLFFASGAIVYYLSKTELVVKVPRLSMLWTLLIVVALLTVLVQCTLLNIMSEQALQLLELCIVGICVFMSVRALPIHDHGPGQGLGRWIVLAGDGSYSTYLTHGFVMGPVARVLPDAISPAVFAYSMVLVCTGVGMFLYLKLEKPVLQYMNDRWGGERWGGKRLGSVSN